MKLNKTQERQLIAERELARQHGEAGRVAALARATTTKRETK